MAEKKDAATETYETLSGLLTKAHEAGEVSHDKFERVSTKLRAQFAAEIEQEEDGMDVEKEVPEHLQCMISWAPLLDPVITPGGLTYEKSVILDHLRRGNNFEPVTREPLRADQLYPNKAIRDAVDIYAEEHPECF